MRIEHVPHAGPPPAAAELEARLRHEARDVYGWANGPGDRYAEHAHAYTKLLYCTAGSIDFVLGDGRTVTLRPGDRLVLPAGTAHGAIVGPAGCRCVEGKL
ncbi:MAG TPA: cupin domain-containing protein [Candidatus Limnocylindria bacterium]|nr:cupin domain-containing protein [Candidatus Limnocylindria bacterium]